MIFGSIWTKIVGFGQGVVRFSWKNVWTFNRVILTLADYMMCLKISRSHPIIRQQQRTLEEHRTQPPYVLTETVVLCKIHEHTTGVQCDSTEF